MSGNRDDLCLDRSRCLRIRFNGSACCHCQETCPAVAILLEQGLEIDSKRCTGCLLCSTVCPTGALELSADFLACVARLSKVPEPVLGCSRTREQANAWLPCLGGLSEEHLLYLSRQLAGKLTLNISLCADCPNSVMLPLLQTRLSNLSEEGSYRVSTAETADAVSHSDETVDRRSFFKSFRSSLFQTAAVVISAGTDRTELQSDYTGKRLPERRKLLLTILGKVEEETRYKLEERFFGRILFNENCTACQACAAACPTGALSRNREQPDSPPLFIAASCTACGLCVEFCMEKGVELKGFMQQSAGYVCSPPETPHP